MIERVTYARLYALPGFENERFEAVVIVQDGDVDAAFDEARQCVEAQYARVMAEPPATAKQLRYIGQLQDDLCWTSEQINAYAAEQSVNLTTMAKGQASAFIDGMKRLAEERNEERPPPLADGYLPF